MIRWLALLFLLAAGPASSVTCEDVTYQDVGYTVCKVNAETENLRLFHSDDDGNVLGGFRAVEAALAGDKLAFAMNAGMYHDDRAPVGHYVEDGVEQMRVISSAGPGNFGLLPNGVFCIGVDAAQVYETMDYVARSPDCAFASQSGPMLVIGGELHPRFLPHSTSRHIRNGVGTSADGKEVVFGISNERVTFHEFGSFFRDFLQLPNALFFDGRISRLHAPDIGRSDVGFRLGPIVGVVEDQG